ncbi:hypothetical protein HDU98_005415 [Podochytrium sp. JEL0797]|nr:hypothetical protein HDU98_005415 [Podochytrium sp. JEL0797]
MTQVCSVLTSWISARLFVLLRRHVLQLGFAGGDEDVGDFVQATLPFDDDESDEGDTPAARFVEAAARGLARFHVLKYEDSKHSKDEDEMKDVHDTKDSDTAHAPFNNPPNNPLPRIAAPHCEWSSAYDASSGVCASPPALLALLLDALQPVLFNDPQKDCDALAAWDALAALQCFGPDAACKLHLNDPVEKDRALAIIHFLQTLKPPATTAARLALSQIPLKDLIAAKAVRIQCFSNPHLPHSAIQSLLREINPILKDPANADALTVLSKAAEGRPTHTVQIMQSIRTAMRGETLKRNASVAFAPNTHDSSSTSMDVSTATTPIKPSPTTLTAPIFPAVNSIKTPTSLRIQTNPPFADESNPQTHINIQHPPSSHPIPPPILTTPSPTTTTALGTTYTPTIHPLLTIPSPTTTSAAIGTTCTPALHLLLTPPANKAAFAAAASLNYSLMKRTLTQYRDTTARLSCAVSDSTDATTTPAGVPNPKQEELQKLELHSWELLRVVLTAGQAVVDAGLDEVEVKEAEGVVRRVAELLGRSGGMQGEEEVGQQQGQQQGGSVGAVAGYSVTFVGLKERIAELDAKQFELEQRMEIAGGVGAAVAAGVAGMRNSILADKNKLVGQMNREYAGTVALAQWQEQVALAKRDRQKQQQTIQQQQHLQQLQRQQQQLQQMQMQQMQQQQQRMQMQQQQQETLVQQHQHPNASSLSVQQQMALFQQQSQQQQMGLQGQHMGMPMRRGSQSGPQNMTFNSNAPRSASIGAGITQQQFLINHQHQQQQSYLLPTTPTAPLPLITTMTTATPPRLSSVPPPLQQQHQQQQQQQQQQQTQPPRLAPVTYPAPLPQSHFFVESWDFSKHWFRPTLNEPSHSPRTQVLAIHASPSHQARVTDAEAMQGAAARTAALISSWQSYARKGKVSFLAGGVVPKVPEGFVGFEGVMDGEVGRKSAEELVAFLRNERREEAP